MSLPAASLWKEWLDAGVGNAGAACELLLTAFLWQCVFCPPALSCNTPCVFCLPCLDGIAAQIRSKVSLWGCHPALD